MNPDSGGIEGITAWIPPYTDGAKIINEWRVTEPAIGELALLTKL
ncbi:MAG: hypothetical protein SAJ12_03370 [Jaaginema sp. PMC 1079.18]|nr:hypothetical protein [Jaaginema sp. PMC 1080.18]MEC4850028.1 hypothetical protein [Jaaginema sp. PMC 1079.18]MEC4867442.1 hypothetical protein [Jaaginema sp. PMC 1078.18]